MLQQRVSEVRTQVYFPAVWHRKLQDAAKKRGVSMATAIREAVKDKYNLTEEQGEKEREKSWKALMNIAGIGKRGPRDVSQRPGEYWAQAIEQKLKRKGAM